MVIVSAGVTYLDAIEFHRRHISIGTIDYMTYLHQ